MYRYLFITSFIIFFLNCSGDKTAFQIEGTVKEGAGQWIYLNELTTKQLVVQDSAEIDENGHFELNGNTEISTFMTVNITGKKPIYLVVAPGDNIKLSTQVESFALDYMINGSFDSQLIQKLIVRQNETIEDIKDLATVYRKRIAEAEEKEAVVAERNRKREEIVENQRMFTERFIHENPGSLASLMALYQYIDPGTPVFRPEKDFEIFVFVDSVLMQKYPSSEAVKSLNRFVVKHSQRARTLGVGDIAPEIALPNPAGDTILLSSLKGNYVLLDFWASWCPPCRKENPNLVKAYEQFHANGFEIFQVSLDKTQEDWIKGIESDNLSEWTHVSDLQYWNSYPARLYGINQIPSSFLLDPQMKIIAVDLREEQLINELQDIFN